MAAAMKGDVARLADLSFDCIMCGLCAARCPAKRPNITLRSWPGGLWCYLAPHSQHLAGRLEELKAGQYSEELAQLKQMAREELVRSTGSGRLSLRTSS